MEAGVGDARPEEVRKWEDGEGDHTIDTKEVTSAMRYIVTVVGALVGAGVGYGISRLKKASMKQGANPAVQ